MIRRLLPLRRGAERRPGDPQCAVVSFSFGRPDRCTKAATPLHDLHSASGEWPELNDDGELEPEVYGVAWITRAALPAAPTPTHAPCCSSHGVPMTCARYRRTHYVEVRPCCAIDAARLEEDPTCT